MYSFEALEQNNWELSEITSICLNATPVTVHILNVRVCMHLDLCSSVMP
jgi:hypothetical protein